MVRAPRYGYRQGYASWQRQPLWQEGERIDKWNPYYRQDLTGEDEEISLEDVEGGKPPTYVPQIDRQALGYKDVLGPRNHPWQAHGGPTDLIAPPDKPQQDTQSVAAIFGSPQSGASSMAEDPRQKAARIAREAFSRDPSLVKEFLPKLRDVGVDPALGAPEGWSLPEAPETWPKTPGFGTETEAERAARRAEQEAAYRRDTFPPGTGIPGPAVPGGPRPGEPPVMPPAQQDTQSVADIFSGGGGISPLISRGSPDYRPGAGLIAGNAGRAPQPRPEEFGPPAPYSGPVPRDPMPRPYNAPGTMERMRESEAGMPRPRPEEFGPYEGIPGQVADLRNGPRDITRGLIAGGQEARLPIARPAQQGDVAALTADQRLEPFTGPAPPVSPELAAAAGRATRPTNPFLTELPSLGAINQTVQRAPVLASPIDPAAIAEVRQTLQLHPDAGRIRTKPGFQQYLEPARTRPVPGQAEAPLIRPDLTEAAANYTPPTPRAPRPRPEEFGPPIDAMEAIGSDVPGPQSGLPTSVMESIYHPNYNPTASGGPATPEEEADAKERLGWVLPNDLIAGPEAGAINAGQPLSPPPEATVPPPITEQQVIDDRPPLIAPSQDYANYAGPTAKSRRTGFLGNVFDREHFVGGPGLTRPIGEVTDYTKSAKPGRGKYKPAEHERLARNIGKTAGLVTSAVTGAPLTATMPLFGAAGAMINRARDPNRQVIERGPFRFFGGIFGRGKDKKKNDANGTPPMDTRPAGVAESMGRGGGSGLGSDRGSYGGYGYGGYQGGTYGGGYYGPGGLTEGVGGAYHNR